MARIAGFAATAAFALLACSLSAAARENVNYIAGRAGADGIAARNYNANANAHAHGVQPAAHAKAAKKFSNSKNFSKSKKGKHGRGKGKKCPPRTTDPAPAPTSSSSAPASSAPASSSSSDPAPSSSDPAPEPTATSSPASPPPASSSSTAPAPPSSTASTPTPVPPTSTETPEPPSSTADPAPSSTETPSSSTEVPPSSSTEVPTSSSTQAPAPPSSTATPTPSSTETQPPAPPSSSSKPSSTSTPPPPPSSSSKPQPPPSSSSKPSSTSTPPPPPSSTSTPPPAPPSSTPKPPPTSSSSAPAPPPTPSTNKRKVGIAADWSSPQSVFANFKTADTLAAYNWSPWRPDNFPDVDFWPMLHGEESIKDWGHVVKGYATTAMGLNEVNQQGQSVTTVQRGIDIWKQYLMPLKSQGYRLLSHSTNQAPDGLDWHNQFRSGCSECYDSIDAYSVHWYGTSPDDFKSYISGFHNATGKPLVVTEFACIDFSGQSSCNAAQAKTLMDNLVDWMHQPAQDYVQGFFWFGMWPGSPTSLVNADGSPNDLGSNYKGK